MNVRDYYLEPNLEGGRAWEWALDMERGHEMRRIRQLERERERAMIERRRMWEEDIRVDRSRG